MLHILIERLRQGRRTVAFPKALPPLPPRYRGLPVLSDGPCADGCASCAGVCPTGALGADDNGLFLDLGRCILCGTCVTACPAGRVKLTNDPRMTGLTTQGNPTVWQAARNSSFVPAKRYGEVASPSSSAARRRMPSRSMGTSSSCETRRL